MALPLPPPGAFGIEANAGLDSLLNTLRQKRAMEMQQQQMAKQQAQFQAQQQQQQFTNDLNLRRLELEEKKFKRPLQPQSGLGKALSDLQTIKSQYGPESMQYKLAHQYVNRLAEGTPGASLTVDKDGNISFSQGGSRGRQGGIVNVDGQQVMIPTQAMMTAEQKAEAIEKRRKEGSKIYGKSPYLQGRGKGAADLASDWLKYQFTNNPEEKKRLLSNFSDFANDWKVAFDLASSNLGNKNIPVTNKTLFHELNRMGIDFPAGTEEFLKWFMPGEAHQMAREKFNTSQERMAKAGSDFIRRGFVEPKSGSASKYADIGNVELEKKEETRTVSPNGKMKISEVTTEELLRSLKR